MKKTVNFNSLDDLKFTDDLILDVRDLHTTFYTHMGQVKAVRGVSFNLHKGEILGIVGESGSGKSVTAMSIMGLVDEPGKISGGSVWFGNLELSAMTDRQLNLLRGKELSMIFQDPMTSLNPVFRIGNQMVEVIRTHTDMTPEQAHERALELLRLVGIPEPETRIKQYAHQFSGGMRQRVMIAMALACNPKVLIADEPTTALDVTIQAQILELILKMKNHLDSTVILITHDLGVVSEICTKVNVMYGGLIMEKSDVCDLFENAQHPYTNGLLQSVPTDMEGVRKRLIPIEGTPPDLLNPPTGCPFSPRCPHAMGICMKEAAPLFKINDKHYAACWLHSPEAPEVAGYVKSKEVER